MMGKLTKTQHSAHKKVSTSSERAARRRASTETAAHSDFGIGTERAMDSRRGGARLGFADFIDVDADTMSDLNVGTNGRYSYPGVDSLSGDDSNSNATQIASYDTITDTNTLTSASLIAGVYEHQQHSTGHRIRRGQRAEDVYTDPETERVREEYETDRIQNAADADENLGMRDVSDEETVQGYFEAQKNTARTQKKTGHLKSVPSDNHKRSS